MGYGIKCQNASEGLFHPPSLPKVTSLTWSSWDINTIKAATSANHWRKKQERRDRGNISMFALFKVRTVSPS